MVSGGTITMEGGCKLISVHYVYLLYVVGTVVPPVGQSGSRATYVGMAEHPYSRLKQHNSGMVTATRGRQWRLVAVVPCHSRKEAAIVERWLKCGDSRSKRMRMHDTFRTVREIDAHETREFISDALAWDAIRRAKMEAKRTG